MIREEPDHPVLLPGPASRAPRFPDRLRLPLTFDPDLLARDLDRLSSREWIRHYVRQNYDGDWSIVALRSPAGETHPIRMIYADPTARSFVDTPLLQGCDYFRRVLDTFECPLRVVRLMRLTPGSRIKEHTDLDLSFEDGMVRVHIPVTTNPEVEFQLNGSRVVLAAGSAWYLRLSDPHSVANRGSADRVHLVVDADVNAWVEALFEAAMRSSS
jgi:quercetin dioxygenase-like cupin family protein